MNVILRFQTLDEYTTWVLENPDVDHMAFVAETTRVYYGIDVPPEPFFIEALQDGTPVTMSIGSYALKDAMEYSLDGVNWLPMPSIPEFTLENAGDRIYFKSPQAPQGQLTFTSNASSKPYKVGGALNSLCNDIDVMPSNAFEGMFKDNKAVVDASNLVMPERVSDYCYCEMFNGCESLQAIPALPAEVMSPHCYEAMFMDCPMLKSVDPDLLPATTLSDYCYLDMFKNSGLVETPNLPALSTAPHCYDSMFENCDNLTTASPIQAYTMSSYACQEMFKDCDALLTAPELPATVLATYCYKNMFENCSHLVASPELPAIELSSHCYEEMFNNCDALVTPPVLPARSLAVSCYEGMFNDCDALTNAPNLPATELDVNCYKNMFNHCDSLKNTPDLPAPYLETGCYDGMFQYCPEVSDIHIGAKEWDADFSSKDWLKGCAPTGTITCPTDDLNIPRDSDSGVPVDWNFSSPKPLTFKSTGTSTVKYSPTLWNSATYSLDEGVTWQPYTGQTLTLNDGESVQFKDSAPATGTERFVVQGNVALSGDIASLNGDNYSTVNPYAFSHLFENCPATIDASRLKLNYDPLSNNCYEYMFWNCTGLTDAPELPAETLAPYCYAHMFEGCTSLVKAPVLPATELAPYCYKEMFDGCSSLLEVTTYANPWNATDTYNWLDGVPEGGTFYNYGGATDIPQPDTSGCPYGWDIVTHTPYLTFESTRKGTPVTVVLTSTIGALSQLDIKYRTSTTSPWIAVTESSIDYEVTGTVLQFQLGNTRGQTSGYIRLCCDTIHNTEHVKVYGDLHSMMGEWTEPYESMFEYMFVNSSAISDISRLVFPATAPAGVYNDMFANCTALYLLPECLPATTVGEGAYQGMFGNCRSLSYVPYNFLPATTLDYHCYEDMFRDCVNLTSPPNLPATQGKTSCYYQMFVRCTELRKVFVNLSSFATEGLYTSNWLGNVGEYGTLYNLGGATNILYPSADGCPETWQIVNYPPEDFTFTTTTSTPATVTLLSPSSSENASLSTYELYYRTDNVSQWTRITTSSSTFTVTFNNFVSFKQLKGTRTVLFTTPTSSGPVAVRGKLVNMLGDNIATETPSAGQCANMFSGCSQLVNAQWLEFPWYVSTRCYEGMFNGCSNLTGDIPHLPVDKLAPYCYSKMFMGTGYLEADIAMHLGNPVLADHCYSQMFESSGIRGEQLLSWGLGAKSLAPYCFYRMFANCPNVRASFELPWTDLEEGCYMSMFEGCTEFHLWSDLFNLPATVAKPHCYERMFYGCSKYVTRTPEIHFTTLAVDCLKEMCYGCSALDMAYSYVAHWNETYAKNWLYGVASSGIFYDYLSATSLPLNSASGVPVNWTKELPVGELIAEAINTSHTFKVHIYATDGYGIMQVPLSAYNIQYKTSPTGAWKTVTTTSFTEDIYNLKYFSFKKDATGTLYGPVVFSFASDSSGDPRVKLHGDLRAVTGGGSPTETNYYQYMFEYSTALYDISELYFPPLRANTTPCYHMFRYCYGLEKLPQHLPQLVSKNRFAFAYMFHNCTAIENVPLGLLPSTDLKDSDMCYRCMFAGCSRLKQAPIIYAESIPPSVDAKYFAEMFVDCSSLASVTTHVNQWNETVFLDWLRGTQSGGVLHNLGGATDIPRTSSGCPSSWTLSNT